MLNAINIVKVVKLPKREEIAKNTIYYLIDGNSVSHFISNSDGSKLFEISGGEGGGGQVIDLDDYYDKKETNILLDEKVDKENDKGLSTNDYTNLDKEKVNFLEKEGDGSKYLSDDGTYKNIELDEFGVISINNKTGDVILKASDLNTYDKEEVDIKFNEINIPTKTSDLENDSNFVKIEDLDNKQDKLNFDGIGDKYLSDDGTFKEIESSGINDGYTKAEVNNLLSEKANEADISKVAKTNDYNDLDNKPNNLSDFNNDTNFLTQHQDISGKVDKEIGKGLSTNDYTNSDKEKVGKIITNGVGNKYLSDDGSYKSVSGGGGSGSINVIEYDATDSANQIMQTFTLADFMSYENSAIIDATTNQIRPSSNPIDGSISLDIWAGYRPTQFAVAMLDSVPTNGTISIDFSQYEYFTVALYIVGGEYSIEDSLEKYLFRDFQSGYWEPSEDVTAYLIRDSWGDFEFVAKESGLDVFEGEKKTNTMKIPVDSMNLSESLVFRFGTRLDQMLTQFGLTTKEELIQFAKDNGFFDDELLQFIDKSEIAPCVYINGSSEGGLLISPQMDKVLIVITPTLDPYDDSQLDPLFIDPNWTANIELNTSKVLSWKEPEGLEDGTYLKIINGSCSIYGLNCRQGDHVRIYDNGTKGILFAGRG